MNPKDPLTWHDLSKHPFYLGKEFDPAWYDGDLDRDLLLMRMAASKLLTTFPAFSCELFVLDDSSFYVRIKNRDSELADLCPSSAADGEFSYFVDLGSNAEEIRVKTIEELLALLGKTGTNTP